VKGHRTYQFDAADHAVHHGIPVTTVARTIIDLAGCISSYLLGRVIDEALRRRMVTLEEIRAALARIPRGGRRKIRPIEDLLRDRLPGYSPGDSELEKWAIGVLRGAGFTDLELQIPVGAYFVDAGWSKLKVGIEPLGFDPHTTRSAFDHDAGRTTWLQVVAGWTLIFVTSNSTAQWLIDRATDARAKALDSLQRTPL
jgi:hypothetical protein